MFALYREALQKQDLSFASSLLRQNPGLFGVVDDYGNCFLHVCAMMENLPKSKMFRCDHIGALHALKNQNGLIPLECALATGSESFVCEMISDENFPFCIMETQVLSECLSCAIFCKRDDLVNILIKQNKTIICASYKDNSDFNGYFEKPFISAVFSNNLSLVEFFFNTCKEKHDARHLRQLRPMNHIRTKKMAQLLYNLFPPWIDAKDFSSNQTTLHMQLI